MASLRPFRGLRYTDAAGDLEPLLATPSRLLTPGLRSAYADRSPYSAVGVASPEGHGDDRSKFIRYARAAARLAQWRREGVLAQEAHPAFYRLTQRFGTGPSVRSCLLALVEPSEEVIPVEATETKAREDRLRLLEATQTALEPSTALYDDPSGSLLEAIRHATASAETHVSVEGIGTTLETIDAPEAIADLTDAFAGATLYIAEGVDSYQASLAFAGGSPAFVVLASLDDAAFARVAVHRVIRRLSGDRQATLDRLREVFEIEEHHNRNLMVYLDRLAGEGRTAFGMATEGGIGFLLIPKVPIEGPASTWLQGEVFGRLLGVGEADPSLLLPDPVQAIRAADEGAAAAFILPRPSRTDVQDAARRGVLLPANAAQAFPAFPTGLVYASLGDEG